MTEEQREKFIKKRKRAFVILTVVQILCSLVFYIMYFISPKLVIAPFFFTPFFVVAHVSFVTGIVNLRDEGENVKKYQVIRWVLLAFFIISCLFGISAFH